MDGRYQGETAAAVQAEGLREAANAAEDRLSQAHAVLNEIAAKLFGPTPSEVSKDIAAAPGMEASLRRLNQSGNALVDALHSVLHRL